MNDLPDDTDGAEDSSPSQFDSTPAESTFGLESLFLPVAQRYEIKEQVGKGGQGQVFACEDKTLGRIVALKEPNQVNGWSRLQREALIAAKLSHPNIVPVYDISSHDGVPCSIMKLIGKQTLADAIKDFHSLNPTPAPQTNTDTLAERTSVETKQRTLADMLSILKDACNGIAYAHSKNILHRDLKPQNISLGDYGETMVIDWGLACSIHDIQSSSQSHRSGTKKYSSPEQVEGDSSKIGYTSDIYSLGAILFEIITNMSVSDARKILERQGVPTTDAIHPRRFRPDTSPDLDAICCKALHPQPEQRYASVAELVSDLTRYEQDMPVSVRKPTWRDSLRRFSKANYAGILSTATAATITAIAATVIIVITLYKNNQITAAQRDMETALTVADDTIRTLESQDISYYALADAATGRLKIERPSASVETSLPLYRGILKLKDQKYDEALPLLIEATEQDPDRDLALFFLSLTQASLNKHEESITTGKKLADRNQDNVYAQQHVADILIMSLTDINDEEKRKTVIHQTEHYARKAYELDPKYPPALMTYGEVLSEMGEKDQAEKLMMEAVAIDPSVDNKRKLADFLRSEKRIVDALELSEEIISQTTASRLDILRHARILLEHAELEAAVSYFEKFDALQSELATNKQPITSHYNDWGLALAGQGQFSKALLIYEKAKQDFAGNPIFESNLAYALLGSGDKAAAITKLTAAFQSAPAPWTYCLLLQALVVSGEFEEAQKLEASLPPFDPDTPTHYIILRAGLAHLASLQTNTKPSLAASEWPKLAEIPPIKKETWNYYYLEQWYRQLPESQQSAARSTIDRLESIIPSRYPLN